jgi:hypothetical protein
LTNTADSWPLPSAALVVEAAMTIRLPLRSKHSSPRHDTAAIKSALTPDTMMAVNVGVVSLAGDETVECLVEIHAALLLKCGGGAYAIRITP